MAHLKTVITLKVKLKINFINDSRKQQISQNGHIKNNNMYLM